jgi:hypothetical protein
MLNVLNLVYALSISFQAMLTLIEAAQILPHSEFCNVNGLIVNHCREASWNLHTSKLEPSNDGMKPPQASLIDMTGTNARRGCRESLRHRNGSVHPLMPSASVKPEG